MLQRQCDRCKEVMDHEDGMKWMHIAVERPGQMPDEVDLCGDCSKVFDEWFKNPKPPKPGKGPRKPESLYAGIKI